MSLVHFEIPQDAAETLRVSQDRIGDELRLLAAIKLFEIGRVSSGAAARLAGLSRTVFLSRLADYDVSALHASEDELNRDVLNA
jgi:predicted HTH domain antitoxin